MFWFRDTVEGDVRVDVGFTDASLDLQGLRSGFPELLTRLEDQAGARFARLTQVHGDAVILVDAPMELGTAPAGDALVTTTARLGLMIRVADCAPVMLADPGAGVIGAVHAGRLGMVLDIATRTVEVMREQGARDIVAWLGPHVCGGCYEVPEQMRDEVAAGVPESYATTTWGTPSVDIGAGVRAQLARAGVDVVEVGGCTRESDGLHSHRRDGAASGRLAGLVWTT